jgi:RNA polymerase sigma-70 factor (ECF subfamily)
MQLAATTQRATLVLDLFDLYYERVYAFLRKSTTPDVAEDLAQEVFLRLLQHPDLERLTISISYLLKIAHNLLRRRYARAARLRELLEERSHADETLDVYTPGARREAAESDIGADILETALGLLGKDEQDAIRLIVCEGKSYQHAAEALGVSVTTINNWKHRAVVKLRSMVTADGSNLKRVAEFETIEQPARMPKSRHARMDIETKPITVGNRGSDGIGRGNSASTRDLFSWRAAKGEVA